MADIIGTAGTDVLVGTAGDDYIASSGTGSVTEWDTMIGLAGNDTYSLYDVSGGTIKNFIIDDRGTDGGVDAIINAGGMYQSASLGYSSWATAERVGDDLIIHLPSRPYRFRKPSRPEYNIEIVDHYGDAPVESLTASGVTYQLATGSIGSDLADIMAGSNIDDVFTAGLGDDFVFGNGGKDRLDLGGGADVAFGGNGRDRVVAGAGNDTVYGGNGHDVLKGGADHDRIYGEAGNDRIKGDAGWDYLIGADGHDVIRGGAGQDTLAGGTGDDRLFGGKEGDLYQFDANDPLVGWGDDIIKDNGNKPSYLNEDVIELRGFYGASSGSTGEALARVSFARDGLDMLISADGGTSTINVLNMFDDNQRKYFIENLNFNGAYWEPIKFKFRNGEAESIADDRDNGDPFRPSIYNEILFGTNADDMIFGGVGHNFIWTGDGADTLIYERGDAGAHGDYVRVSSHDIVEDFDITQDVLDFQEVETVFAGLTLGEDGDGDATISWLSGNIEEANIFIELRGVALADVTADLFLF